MSALQWSMITPRSSVRAVVVTAAVMGAAVLGAACAPPAVVPATTTTTTIDGQVQAGCKIAARTISTAVQAKYAQDQVWVGSQNEIVPDFLEEIDDRFELLYIDDRLVVAAVETVNGQPNPCYEVPGIAPF